MSTNERCVLPLSELKGIQVYFPNDLHTLAELMIRLSDARAKHVGSKAISRPTVNGLAKTFAQLIDACNPDYQTVFDVIEQQGLPLGVAVELDENCQHGVARYGAKPRRP
jgi:hypothetical protein